jgi:hypothetical protein
LVTLCAPRLASRHESIRTKKVQVASVTDQDMAITRAETKLRNRARFTAAIRQTVSGTRQFQKGRSAACLEMKERHGAGTQRAYRNIQLLNHGMFHENVSCACMSACAVKYACVYACIYTYAYMREQTWTTEKNVVTCLYG